MVLTMASASSGVMNSLLAKLTALMAEEYGKLKGVQKEVKFLQDEFRSMTALLDKLADMDDLDDSQVKEWRNQVREMSYDIEDCIDDFMHHLNNNDASIGFVNRTARLLKKLRVRHQIANKIQEVKSLVKVVSERRMRYKIDEYNPKCNYVHIDPRVVAIYAEAAGLVGIDVPRYELTKLLMSEEAKLRVASIVGFGGLGKTTLAIEVYRKLESQFDCRAFVSVSQRPDITRVLNIILSELKRQYLPQMYEEQLHHTCEVKDLLRDIRNLIHDKRYFIIIDDLWHSSAWDVIKCAFPENNCGSRVLTTTRIHSVAIACCSSSQKYVYRMKSLSAKDSKKLFFNRIFGSQEVISPDTFEDISADILKKCGGLPLAIISIASLLAGQPKTKWEYVRNSLACMFEGNPTLEGMKQILDLSYRDLPHHLKTCLLYLGMYPEDYIIEKQDLVRQWTAEGFVSKLHGLDMEDVAGSYFNELINRSMIQPVDTDCNDEVLSCRIHDIMLDLIRSRSAEENFTAVIGDLQAITELHRKIRRVSLQNDGEDHSHSMASTIIKKTLSKVRSLVSFGIYLEPSFFELKYIRVLVLYFPGYWGDSRVDLAGISGLLLLRYLKIVNILFELPGQLGDLRHLETLELDPCWGPVNIPSDIVRLPRLLHLIVPRRTQLPDGIGELKSLRTLQWFDFANNSVENIMCLGELTNLRDLRLHWGTLPLADAASRIDALHSSLQRLSHSSNLKNLVAENYRLSMLNFNGLSTLSPSPRHIQSLCFIGCWFSRIPRWISQLRDLYSLEIMVRNVLSKDGDVGILEGLPSLVHLDLKIIECQDERIVISGTSMSFRALKHLLITSPKLLLTFGEGALPRIQKLDVRFNAKWCDRSTGTCCLPIGSEHLPASLREIHVEQMGTGASKCNLATAESALRNVFGTHHPDAALSFTGYK